MRIEETEAAGEKAARLDPVIRNPRSAFRNRHLRNPHSAFRDRTGRWKNVVLVLLALAVILQIPSLYQLSRFYRLSTAIDQLKSERRATESGALFKDYKGVLHVHSMLGGHSTGSLADVVAGAKSNTLDFVVMTEHPAAYHNTAAATLQGNHDGTLFVSGNEIATASQERLLMFGGNSNIAASTASPVQELIDVAKRSDNLTFIAHPEDFRSWQMAQGCDGIEVYNLHASARRVNRLRILFAGLWSFWFYPELLFTILHHQPIEYLKAWDALTSTGNRKVVAIAGNDAHANLGLTLQHATGKKIINLKLDPYETTFQVVRTHVLIDRNQTLNQRSLLGALKAGHCYVSFDVFSDASGFYFTADNESETKIMGDEIKLTNKTRLTIGAPLACHLLLIKDGAVLRESRNAARMDVSIDQPGVYRVEARLNQLGGDVAGKPWIISNPIYVRDEHSPQH